METTHLNSDIQKYLRLLPQGFNKKKLALSYVTVNHELNEIQNLGKRQCLGLADWPIIDKITGWMVSAETATFMKIGGLGMVASELPEVFNLSFEAQGDTMTVVTPMYLGDTGKKKCVLDQDIYTGSERRSVKVKKFTTLTVPFMGEKDAFEEMKVDVFCGRFANTNYIFLANKRFFSINPNKKNPTGQDGCYIYNEFGVDEVERFAFFSKAVYELVKYLFEKECKGIDTPNTVIANDWHSGALSGLMKYFTRAQFYARQMEENLAKKMALMPIIHIAHHLGYQGWDYPNTTKILNSLYESTALMVFKNARSIKNSNPRGKNTLIVYDCYNQASANLHLADRVVTVSRNYMEEVSKELDLGYDFRDILKIRKDHRTFMGIVNGYDKKLISPNQTKIEALNKYFEGFNFKYFDENSLEAKSENKKEFIKLISKIASDEEYKKKTIPLIDIYKFKDISKTIKNPEKVPVICATSRLVEQKGYDIAADAILHLIENKPFEEYPIFVLGGAGGADCFTLLTGLKDKVAKINKSAADRIFVFKGYRDEFAYAVQLASDFYMMPSHFEPCGLNQMEAMAKGALPIATSAGGLVDTINNGVDGFRTEVFFAKKTNVYGTMSAAKRLKDNETAYLETLDIALNTFYTSPEAIHQMTVNAMKKDFSWDVPDGPVYKYRNLLRYGHL